MTTPEPYLWPKELSHEVHAQRGLVLKVERIYAIRLLSEADQDGTFIDGRATVAGVIDWLRTHPGFTQRPQSVRVRQHSSGPVMI
jgi:hypothetical protein